MTETLTAERAFDLYKDFFDRDALVQGEWHSEADDGRALACGLGVLGPDIDSPSDCPSSVMPRWLAQMVPWFFDNQGFADAKDWGIRFYAELKRLNGAVPFRVVHDWQANVVAPLGLEWREKKDISPDATLKVQALHRAAVDGGKASKDEWTDALRPMFRESYANANAYANADRNLYQVAIKRLADGMIDCLARVAA